MKKPLSTSVEPPHPADASRIPTRWRRSGRALVGLLLFALAVAVLWWGWRPHYRPGLNAGETYGVDVSNHQGQIDWPAVARDDVDFAYIKATEGGDFIDALFAKNWAQAQSAGLEVGAYHFFTLCRPGKEQAANFLNVVPDGEADLQPAIDLEFPGNCSNRPSIEWVHDEVARWIDDVESQTGQRVLLYVQTEFDDLYAITETFAGPTWHRKILRRPGDDRWTFWQWSYFSDVDGISGGVDLNVRRPTS